MARHRFTGDTPPGLSGGGGGSVAGTDITGTIAPEGRLLGKQGANLDSTLSDIVMGQGNYFQVTGAGTIHSASSSLWEAGTVVVWHFLGAATVVHDSGLASFDPIALAGAADFTASAGDTLALLFDGSVWREISRSVI